MPGCSRTTHFFLAGDDGCARFVCLEHVSGGTQKQVDEVYEFISAVNVLSGQVGGDRMLVSKGRQLLIEAAVQSLPAELQDEKHIRSAITYQANQEWFGVNPWTEEHSALGQTYESHAAPSFHPWWEGYTS